jgi:Scaffold protein Nfu/NifU N terminal
MAEVEALQVRVQRTPNPNSMLFHVNRDLTDRKSGQTFSSPEAAAAAPVAAEIFKVAGVSSVFFLPNSITVTRDPAVSWEDILPDIEEAIRAGLQG